MLPLIALGLIASTDVQVPVKVPLAKLVRSPKEFVSIPLVEVEGVLKNAGKSYFKGARFEIREGDSAFEVAAWLPLEVAQPRSGTNASRRKVMSDFLSRKVRLQGRIVAVKAESETEPKERHRFSVERAEVISPEAPK